MSLVSAGIASGQSLTAVGGTAWAGDPSHVIALQYIPGPDSGSLDFELAFDGSIVPTSGLPTVTIANGEARCRQTAMGRLKCLVNAGAATGDLGAGSIGLPFTIAGTSGIHPLTLVRVGFYDQNGRAESGTVNAGNLAIAVQPRLSVADASTSEGDSGSKSLQFTVSLEPASASDVSFHVTTHSGSALPGSDFTPPNAGAITIPAGQSSALVSIPVLGDLQPESAETFSLHLLNPTGAGLADGQGVGTILDDDIVATLSIADRTILEGNTGDDALLFEVVLSKPMPTPVTFNIATESGSATGGVDFIARQASRTIDPGRTRARFEVAIIGDQQVEADENFTVSLSGVAGASVLDGSAAGLIQDDDSAALTTSIAAIQGSSTISPLAGRAVKTEGVVTALVEDGFFLQSLQPDADPATSEGIFVLSADRIPARGDRVEVAGSVTETFVGTGREQLTLTQLVAESLQVTARGLALPAPARVATQLRPGAPLNAVENFEGMRVIAALRVVGPSAWQWPAPRNARRAGVFHAVTGGPRPFQERGRHPLTMYSRDGAALLRHDGNVERLVVDTAAQRGSSAVAADVGDLADGVIGVLSYGDGLYQLLPDPTPGIELRSGARPTPARPAGDGEVSIARMSFGVLQIPDATTSGRVDPDYALRMAKAANAVCAYVGAPDLVVLDGDARAGAVEELVQAINARDAAALFGTGCPAGVRYRILDAGTRAGDRAALLAKDSDQPGPRLEAALRQGTSLVRERGGPPDQSEDSVAAVSVRIRWQDGRSTELAVVAANVFAGDGSGGELARERRLKQLGRLVARERQSTNRLLLFASGVSAESLGARSDLDELSGARSGTNVMRNLAHFLPPAERYNVVRAGNATALDHALATKDLLTELQVELRISRLNANFSDENADDAQVPMRVSERDPMVVYVRQR